MTPKLVGFGSSFRGLGLYVLHDPDKADSAERLAWTETRNLGTDDPDLAWRVMAATALNQASLKKQAGIPSTGRKSNKHVAHLVLSWHPEEKAGLTREEMLRAANGALRAIGADDRQVLIAAHDDKDNPHLHAVINRVSPEDGRMLNPSYPHLKLSTWAEQYEKERGKIYCENRVANNAARKRGEFTRGHQHRPRHLQELEAANQNRPDFEQIKQQQRKLDAKLAQATRVTRARRQAEWREMQQRRQQALRTISDEHRKQWHQEQHRIRAAHRAQWIDLQRQQRARLDAFDRRESHLLGRLRNVFTAVDLTGIVMSPDRRRALTEAYDQIASAGKRRAQFLATQETAQRQLQRRQQAAEKARRAELRRAEAARLAERRALYLAERHTLVLKHNLEDVKERNAWKQRREARRLAYEKTRTRTGGSVGRHDATKRPAGNDNRPSSSGVPIDDLRDVAKELGDMKDQQKRERDRGPDQGDDFER